MTTRYIVKTEKESNSTALTKEKAFIEYDKRLSQGEPVYVLEITHDENEELVSVNKVAFEINVKTLEKVR